MTNMDRIDEILCKMPWLTPKEVAAIMGGGMTGQSVCSTCRNNMTSFAEIKAFYTKRLHEALTRYAPECDALNKTQFARAV